MKIVVPQQVTPARLVSSNVPENDAPVWSAGTNYLVGDMVIYDHRVYESLVHPNTGHQPDISPTQWLDLGATNRFRMFDEVLGNPTSNPMTVEVVIQPNAVINSVSFFGLSGSTVNVMLTDPVEGVVYDRTVSLQDNTAIVNWYAYFFEPITALTDVVLTDLPSYGSAQLSATVDAGDNVAEVGEMVIGAQRILGDTLFGTSVSIQDYSRKERDQFGNIVVVERRFSKLVDYDVAVPTMQVAQVQSALAAFRARPIVYIGQEEKTETVVFGFFRNFSIVLDSPSISSCSIEVEGLV